MIYTPLTRKAMKIAYAAHRDQVDKSGVPYIFHPVHLAEQCQDELSCTAALLHDVLEDCPDYSTERLRAEGIPDEVLETLKCLTHEDGIPYLDYVKELKKNETARKVKILDLAHNLDASRLDTDIPQEVRRKLEKKHETYRAALKLLQEV